jgi:hypothetical protein
VMRILLVVAPIAAAFLFIDAGIAGMAVGPV